MKILVTGASGFVGTHVLTALGNRSHELVAVDRTPPKSCRRDVPMTCITADTTLPGDWQSVIPECDVIVNLAGKSIFSLWNDEYKQAIHNSRIRTTKRIVESIDINHPPLLVNASAVGFYGSAEDEILTESRGPGNDFLAQVCVDWEAAALMAEKRKSRVVILRLGIVLGDGGGALSKMIPAYRMFVGGPLGDGSQWMPWVHVDDIVGAIVHAIDNAQVQGVYNMVGKTPVTNAEFSKTLARRLYRPDFLSVPSFVLKTVLGEFGSVLLSSQRAVPERLLESGYTFRHPELVDAIDSVATAAGY